MRVFLVVENTHFYLPAFVGEFLSKTTDQIVGAALITKVASANGMIQYAERHWWNFTPWECAQLCALAARLMLAGVITPPRQTGPFQSIRSVLRAFGIPRFDVRYDINRPEHVERVRAANPDVIVNLGPLIFGAELLGAARVCCLNRHSSLLPAYGGHWPVFQAYRAGETVTGVSVHVMDRHIDHGTVLCQCSIPIERGDSIVALYQRCFDISATLLLEALDRVRADDFTPRGAGVKPSYFSFPTKLHWKEFRERGGKIC